MRIAVDGYNIAMLEGTGIARYGRNLIVNLLEDDHEVGIVYGADFRSSGDDAVAYSNFIWALSQKEKKRRRRDLMMDFLAPKNLVQAEAICRSDLVNDYGVIPEGIRHVWNIRNLYSRASRHFRATGEFLKISIEGVDLVHWTSVLPITAVGAKNIYTIHDMIPIKIPHLVGGSGEYYYNVCRKIYRDSDAVITVSERSRRDIIEFMGKNGTNVYNTYLDVSKNILNVINLNENEVENFVQKLLGVNYKEYFLFYGAWEPKKNLRRIIEAFLLSETDCPLIICGGGGWANEGDKSFLASIKSDKIRRLPYVSDEILGLVIRGARATLFPSLYEGFGLPVIESMSLGTAVISSDAGSIPEIAGGAALLADPYDVTAIAKAIRVIDSDGELRGSFEVKGLDRAREFRSEIYRERIREIYCKI